MDIDVNLDLEKSRLIRKLADSVNPKLCYFDILINSKKIITGNKEEYLHYFIDEESYSRNSIYRNDSFELVLICWKEGQKSLIHDHAKSDCFMTCVAGELVEERYSKWEARRLSVETISTYKDSCHIGGGNFLHRLSSPNTDSVSLHLYIPEIKSNEVTLIEL